MRALLLLFGLLSSLALAIPVEFRYEPPEGLEVRSVSLRGSFNNWGETPMAPVGGGFAVTLDLSPGEYAYKFFINGTWPKDMCYDPTFGRPPEYKVDHRAQDCVDDGFGGRNALLVVGAPPKEEGEAAPLDFTHEPEDPAYVSFADGGLVVRFRAGERSVQKATLLFGEREIPMHLQLRYPGAEVWRAKAEGALRAYRIRVETAEGAQVFGPFTPPETPFREVEWVGEGVGYQVFPDRFQNGDPKNDALALLSDEYHFNRLWSGPPPVVSSWTDPPHFYHCCHQYYGGDLQGLLERLPYMKALGVTLLYLNPIFLSGSVHGYDTHDYLEVAPRLGDKPLLKRVLEEAHRQRIRVLFDFVPNHTGLGFWAFQDVVQRGPNSPYWNWYFIRKWPFTPGDPGAYEGWWGLGSLPKLNTGNPGVRRYLLEVAEYWVRFGFDGVRVDVPGDLIDAHGFFKDLRKALKAIRPDAYLVGEIWQKDPSWLKGDEFDSLMNYALGRDILLRYARGSALYPASRAAADLARLFADYPEAALGMGFNLVGSHDTERILTALGGGGLRDTPSLEARARQRLLAALLYALPGVPVTFQGDECGFTGEKPSEPPYDLHRYPLQWDRCHQETLAFYQALGRLRAELPALRSSLYRSYLGEGFLLAFLRGEPGAEEVLAAFNSGKERATLPLPEGRWQDPLEGRAYRGKVEVEPLGFRYLVRLP
ncbi:alpha-amylase family glycosyl hydrolase [Thermus sp.]|uniref:alpha-amylase family glycosyl hydrolase n=1 Tax=Thermus sp. TaxID=275 RepID=UPI00307CF4FE